MSSPALPDEIWIAVFRLLDADSLWLGVRKVDEQFRACADEVVRLQILQQFSIGLDYSLGAAERHRWYDVRGGIMLGFTGISRLSPQYAAFGESHFHPDTCTSLAREKWHRLCIAGFGQGQEWRVQKRDGETHCIRLPRLVVSDDHTIWCDWREMLNAYFGE